MTLRSVTMKYFFNRLPPSKHKKMHSLERKLAIFPFFNSFLLPFIFFLFLLLSSPLSVASFCLERCPVNHHSSLRAPQTGFKFSLTSYLTFIKVKVLPDPHLESVIPSLKWECLYQRSQSLQTLRFKGKSNLRRLAKAEGDFEREIQNH